MCPVSHCSYSSACNFCHLLKSAFVIESYLLLDFFLHSKRETKNNSLWFVESLEALIETS